MKIAVTGANSSVGLILLDHLISEQINVVAGIRSDRARDSLPQSELVNPVIIDYQNIDGLSQALAGCDCVIHLAGILIESRHSNYATANVAATAAVSKAAVQAGVKHLVFISVVGADANSGNAYFRSKGVGEDLVSQSGLNCTVLRTPMLLGPGAAGAASLVGTAGSGQAKVLGGGHYSMRPLDIDDLSRAIITVCKNSASGTTVHELVGPEAISYSDLIARTAKKMGKDIEIKSIPVWTAKIVAGISCVIKRGGISPTVIDVITQDETVDNNADTVLGIELTPLEETLNKIIRAQAS